MPWSMEQKIFCVKTYYETKSFKIVQARFRRKFSFNQFPNRSQIFKLVKKFEAHGTCGDRRVAGSSPSGPPITISTPDNVSSVQESVGRSPSKSLCRRSQELGISVSSVRRMLVKDLKLYPYRIHVKHELTENDKEKRVAMCQWFSETIDNNEKFLNDVWFSDEAHFLLNGHVNSKNWVFWGSKNPHRVVGRPWHSKKCTAWVAISTHGIIGPFFFEDDHSIAVTVTKERYVPVLEQFWGELDKHEDLDEKEQWFQQDGAPPHTANVTMAWLREKFGKRLISRKAEVEWAPHSPELNPPDLFLWGFLKDNIYQDNPLNIAALKAAITEKIQAITQEECERVINNFARHIQECLRQNGGHLEHVL